MAIGVSLWHRQLVFPIGRHTLMHMWLPQSTAPTLAAHGGNQGKLARTVYNATRTVVGGTDLLRRWHEKVMAHNLELIEAAAGISLAEYVSAVARVSDLSSKSAFAEMCAFAHSEAEDRTLQETAARRKGSGKRRPTKGRR
jgi:hypothetical protein